MVDIDIEAIIAEQRAAEQHALADHIRTATFALETIETVHEFALAQPLRGGDYLRGSELSRIRVTVTRFPGTEEEPYTRVQGYCHPVRVDGTRKANGTPIWVYLPDELATDLLAHANA